MWRRHIQRVLLGGLLLVSCAAAQEPAPPGYAPAEAQTVPTDPLGRTTPYGTVVGFMRAVETHELARSADFLDSRGSDEETHHLAEQLRAVLNRAMTLEIGSLSHQPAGDLEDNLRKSRERVGVAVIGSDRLPIYLDLVERQGQPSIWLFSAETLVQIPEFARRTDVPWQEKYLPRSLLENRFVSIELYRWIAVPFFLILTLIGTKLIVWLLSFFLGPMLARLTGRSDDRVVKFATAGPLRLLIFSIAIRAFASLSVTALARHFWEIVTATLIVFSIAWLLIRVIRAATNLTTARMKRIHAPEKIALANLAGRMMQMIVGLTSILVVLRIVGVDLTGILAGLGLGGVALALGAQKTLENFLGGVMIIWDAPVRVGDLCRVGDHKGVIEDIGLRSTRMRTSERTLVHVPNAQLSAISLENVAERDKIRFHHTLGLQRETTLDQLRSVLEKSQEMLASHPGVESTSARVSFTKVGESSLDIEAFAYVHETKLPAFLAVQEAILLKMLAIIEESGTRLAMPCQVTYELDGATDPASQANGRQK